MKRLLTGMAFALAALSVPGHAAAQVFTPSYLAPRGGGTLGVYVSDTFNDAAVEGILRRGMGGFDIGLRGGLVFSDDPVILLGADLRNPLRIDTAPLDLAFAAGVQGALGEAIGGESALGLQAGLVLGSTFAGEGVSITPYLHPRIAIVAANDDSEAEVLADIGVDVRLQSDLIFKLSLSLNDVGSTIGFGLAFR